MPIPIFPPSLTVNTSVAPSNRDKIFPIPDCTSERSVLAELDAIESASSDRRNWVESSPSNLPDSNADGTEAICFRGDISPSQLGVSGVPPMFTPR